MAHSLRPFVIEPTITKKWCIGYLHWRIIAVRMRYIPRVIHLRLATLIVVLTHLTVIRLRMRNWWHLIVVWNGSSLWRRAILIVVRNARPLPEVRKFFLLIIGEMTVWVKWYCFGVVGVRVAPWLVSIGLFKLDWGVGPMCPVFLHLPHELPWVLSLFSEDTH